MGQVAVQKPQCTQRRRMASASLPRSVSFAQEARWVCMACYSSRIRRPGLKSPAGSEFLLEAARDQRQRWRQRMEHAILRHGHARRRNSVACPPGRRRARAAASLPQASAGRRPTPAASDRDRARRWSAAGPAATAACRVRRRCGSARAANATRPAPRPVPSRRRRSAAARWPARAARRTGARTHALAAIGVAAPAGRGHRQRLAAPLRETGQRLRLRGGPRQRHFLHGLRHDLSDTSRRAPKMPCEPASRRDTS